MSRPFSGSNGTITLPGDDGHQVTGWSISVTTGNSKRWSGSFLAPTATTIALSNATGFIAIDFEDETGGRGTGDITLGKYAIAGRATRIPFTGLENLERDGELFR